MCPATIVYLLQPFAKQKSVGACAPRPVAWSGLLPAMIPIERIREAARAIEGEVLRTPLLFSRTLSAITGARVHVKFENLQFTASFKERGALFRLLQLDPEERARGVIAVSAGNHAQGVAYYAQRLGIPATIVMPRFTPFVKVRHTEAFGARVLLSGDTLAESASFAEQIRVQEGLRLIHPYEDPDIIAGQGTLGLEILEQLPEVETILVPVGGGGLLAGVASAVRALKPEVRLVGVETSGYASLHWALRGEERPGSGVTVAEGIAVKEVGRLNLSIVRDVVSEVLLVDEERIEEAVNLYASVEKTVAEGAGAVTLAAVLAYPQRFQGQTIVLLLSGGNIDSRLLATILTRALVREGRLARLRVEISDAPGSLARVAELIAAGGGNIIEVAHQRLFAQVPVKNAHLDVAVETRDSAHVIALVESIRDAGFRVRQLDDEL